MLNEDLFIFNQMLNCQNCNQRYVEPRLTPCGFTICSNCILQMSSNEKKEFQCKLCSKIHSVPSNGFPINQIAFDLMSHSETNLNMVDIYKKLTLLKFSTDCSESYIKNKCIELKTLVKTRYDEIILELSQMNESLNSQIDSCEHEWLESFKTTDKLKLNDIKTKIYQLHHESNDYLAGNKKIDENLKSRLDLMVDQVNKVLYGDKIAEFKVNTNRLDTDILGNLCIKATINLNRLKTFNLNDQLDDFFDSIFFCGNPNGTFFIIYQNESSFLVLVTFDPVSGKTEKKTLCKCTTFYGITKNKNSIAILLSEFDQDSLLILDTNFKVINEKRIPKMNLRGANDSFLYFSVENNNEPFVIYDWKLNKLETNKKFQNKDENAPFYISPYLDQIDNRNEKFIILHDNRINIVDELTGSTLNSIQIETIYFFIDSTNLIVVFDETNKQMCYYDLNGILVKCIHLENFDQCYGFNVDKNDKLNFFDWNSNIIYYS